MKKRRRVRKERKNRREDLIQTSHQSAIANFKPYLKEGKRVPFSCHHGDDPDHDDLGYGLGSGSALAGDC